MSKIVTIAIGALLSAFLSAAVSAETSLKKATPQPGGQNQYQSLDQIQKSNPPMPGDAALSHRNKAKIQQEQERMLRRETINNERAAETDPQQ